MVVGGRDPGAQWWWMGGVKGLSGGGWEGSRGSMVVGGRGPLVSSRVGEVVRGCQVIGLGWTPGPVLVLQNSSWSVLYPELV